ncbi:hypothetical protein CWE09_05730 [Aliidiomarina minuta]|uniref:Sel1 repeat family protein n=1 Tax=Aliidiomarina minuta TaxID=880057 RepID=A0A432W804_9GAMM|nr:hypothetical protein [Aliidiomarina minuta]RUO26214.1 hypothetical protein CWE09_05730 [Aliidiomarina minuta]
MGETRILKPLMALAVLLLSACSSQPLSPEQAHDESCQNKQQQLPANLISVEQLQQAGCFTQATENLQDLYQQATADERVELAMRLALTYERGLQDEARQPDYAQATQWYEEAAELGELTAAEQLVALHSAGGPLQRIEDQVRYQALLARLQQRRGLPTEAPDITALTTLYVATSRTALLTQPDEDSELLEALRQDEQLSLLDVVLLEHNGEYWVHAYFADTLTTGWVMASDLDELSVAARSESDRILAIEGQSYNQQMLTGAVIGSADHSTLQPLRDDDFFQGDSHQRSNVVALLQAIAERSYQCETEREQMIADFHAYLLREADSRQRPRGTFHSYPNMAWLDRALRVIQQPGQDAEFYNRIREDAADYYKIRLDSPVAQRLCHSLPQAAGLPPEIADDLCLQMSELNQCIGQMQIIDSYMQPRVQDWYSEYRQQPLPRVHYAPEAVLQLQ